MYQQIESVEDALKAAKEADNLGLGGIYPTALIILARHVEKIKKDYVLLPKSENEEFTEQDFMDNVLIHFTSERGKIGEAVENHKELCEYLDT